MNVKIYEPSNEVYIAPGAVVRGNVTLGDKVSVWFNAVVRCEDSTIEIGDGSNVQDCCVVHADPWTNVKIGKGVTIGHGAMIHGCTIGDNCLIGMGAIVLNDAVIGNNCLIGAGTLITEGTVIPDNSMVVGSPGKVKRAVTSEEVNKLSENAKHYVKMAEEYK